MESSEKFKKLIGILKVFVKDTVDELLIEDIKDSQFSDTYVSDWQAGAAAPILTALKRLIFTYKAASRTILKYEADTDQGLSELVESIEISQKQLQIDLSASLQRFFDVSLTLENQKSVVYIGDVDAEDIRTGFGSWSTHDSVYNGEWKDSKKNGFGVQVFSDGSVYKGEWKDGVPLVGYWTLSGMEVFYGYQKLKEDGESFEDWMIGLGVKDSKDVVKDKIINHLYVRGEKTPLKNISYCQELDLEALVGRLEKPRTTEVKYINGFTYTGYFKDYVPFRSGVISSPKNLLRENEEDKD